MCKRKSEKLIMKSILLSSVLNRCVYDIDDKQLKNFNQLTTKDVTKVENTLKTSDTTLNQIVQKFVDFFTDSQYMHQVYITIQINFFHILIRSLVIINFSYYYYITYLFLSATTFITKNSSATNNSKNIRTHRLTWSKNRGEKTVFYIVKIRIVTCAIVCFFAVSVQKRCVPTAASLQNLTNISNALNEVLNQTMIESAIENIKLLAQAQEVVYIHKYTINKWAVILLWWFVLHVHVCVYSSYLFAFSFKFVCVHSAAFACFDFIVLWDNSRYSIQICLNSLFNFDKVWSWL